MNRGMVHFTSPGRGVQTLAHGVSRGFAIKWIRSPGGGDQNPMPLSPPPYRRTDPVRVDRPSAGDPAAGSPHAEAFRVEKTHVEGQSAVVSEAQWLALLKVLESRGGLTILTPPKIQTATGPAAEVQIQDPRTIVTGVDTNGPTSPHVRYHTEIHGCGPGVQIVPSRRSNV